LDLVAPPTFSKTSKISRAISQEVVEDSNANPYLNEGFTGQFYKGFKEMSTELDAKPTL
jgi:hypothetical protein